MNTKTINRLAFLAFCGRLPALLERIFQASGTRTMTLEAMTQTVQTLDPQTLIQYT